MQPQNKIRLIFPSADSPSGWTKPYKIWIEGRPTVFAYKATVKEPDGTIISKTFLCARESLNEYYGLTDVEAERLMTYVSNHTLNYKTMPMAEMEAAIKTPVLIVGPNG